MSIGPIDASFTNGITAVLGPNGAGKSSLFEAIAGVLRLQSGQVEISSNAIERSILAKDFGFAPQHVSYFAGFTVREMVSYAGWLKGLSGSVLSELVDRAINSVDLLEHADTKVRKLSGGMQRRSCIAEALVHNPTVLVLDEPTAGLDPQQRTLFREAILRYNESRIVLFSTHIAEDAVAIAREILVMQSGHVVWRGTPDELLRLGEDNDGSTATSLIDRGYESVIASGDAR